MVGISGHQYSSLIILCNGSIISPVMPTQIVDNLVISMVITYQWEG